MVTQGWRWPLAALALAMLWLAARSRPAASRLEAWTTDTDGRDEPERPEHEGILAVLENVKARIRTGSSLEQAFGEACGGVMAGVATLPGRGALRDLLVEHLDDDETAEQAGETAAELDLACRVSHELGYGALRCMDAVADSYRRNRMMRTLRGNAFAMPKSTVKLLSALPFATLVFGELMGADSLAFLLGTGAGRICLTLGLAAYAIGLMWMRAMMREMQEAAKAFTVPVSDG
ncbi:hypothetical protein PT282_06595 [Bifidobacterium sp. ESL0763]|uniref:type II secretion system F family protein n=1 Tax=Bifidobacterium sp. ESL0763 TaxID=2983227 RepID=UPI0023F7BEB7|nr:hypothetical protein [Bifidobacterium sp. ESL0763]MDF7664327.1 hypothetical protein [Bifidobacterium sp. ESL0763]